MSRKLVLAHKSKLMTFPLHIRKSGPATGIPVILIHGFLETGDVWLPWLSCFFPDNPLLIPDLPGHGKSQPWDSGNSFSGWGKSLVKLIDGHYGKTVPFHLVGHSMGGYLALEIAAIYPRRVQRIVLFNSTPLPDKPRQINRRKKQIKIIEHGRGQLLTKYAGPTMFAPHNQKKLKKQGEEINKKARECSNIGMQNTLRVIMERRDFIPVLFKKLNDTLLITGGSDPFMPEEYIASIMKKFDGLRHVHLPDCGHAAFLEEPEKTALIAKRFLT